MCSATVRQVGDVAIVDLSGRFTVSNAPEVIHGTVARLLASGTQKILLNLEQVTYLDSAAGIGELVSSYTSAERQGARLKLLHADRSTNYILHLLRLDTVFETYDDEDAAVASFRELSTPTWTE